MSSEVPISEEERKTNYSESDNLNASDSGAEKTVSQSNDSQDDKSQNSSLNQENQESDLSEPVKSQSTQIADNEARLEQLEKEHETLKNQYMRIAADFDNFRKRQTRDNDDLRIQLTCTTLSEILPVVDNFERARQQLTPEGEEAQALHRSYQGLYKQLVEVLKKLGVAPMRVVGQQFDPNLHEAVLREPSEEYAEDIVTEELQRGYHLEGRVIRHALVKVSMGPGPKNESINEVEEKPNDVNDSTDTQSPDSSNQEE